MRAGEHLFKRGNIWWVRVQRGQRRMRISLRTSDRSEAARRRDELLSGIFEPHSGWDDFPAASDAELRAYLARSREAAIARDRRRGLTSTLTPDELRQLLDRAEGQCEATHIRFSLAKAPGTFRRPLAPSIDRLDCTLPYSAQNCRLVLLCVNIAVNEWGDRLFRRVAVAFAGKIGGEVLRKRSTKTVHSDSRKAS